MYAIRSYYGAHGEVIAAVLTACLILGWLLFRRPSVRQAMMRTLARLPLIKSVLTFHTTALFCRNLGVLLASGMPLSSALRVLIDMMERSGHPAAWPRVLERVRHGGKLSDALAEGDALPAMAVRMLKLGEETGQLPTVITSYSIHYTKLYEISGLERTGRNLSSTRWRGN